MGGRFGRGEDHHDAKLSEDDVRLLRAAKAERDRLLAEAAQLSADALAQKMEISPDVIRRVWRGDSWSHVA